MDSGLSTQKQIEIKIYKVRGCNVMLDSDLAALYGVKTKVLNQAVKRNLGRFPEDFRFQLTEIEGDYLRSQIVTSKPARGGKRHPSIVFTELGIAMLSSVLNSEQAIQANITIMRAFFELRRQATSDKRLVKQVEKLTEESSRLFEMILYRLDELEMRAPILDPKRRKIGLQEE